jgi:hypothetical protein
MDVSYQPHTLVALSHGERTPCSYRIIERGGHGKRSDAVEKRKLSPYRESNHDSLVFRTVILILSVVVIRVTVITLWRRRGKVEHLIIKQLLINPPPPPVYLISLKWQYPLLPIFC